MKNVYDILKDDKLVYILAENDSKRENLSIALKSAVVIVNLYYPDILDTYLEYLDQIPKEIDVYIISSNPLLERKIKNYINEKDNVHYIKKENRGRDVSALLVTAGDIVMKYEYICFIHDKKPNFDYLADDICFWNQNLWDNTLKSKQYIENVLEILEGHKNIGLLVPPKPVGKYIPDWHTNAWRDDFEMVQQLCREFSLKCDLDFQKPVLTLGTVFWGKTRVFRKILSKKWKYEDFPDEPMPLDGTISHGLERILAYAAQDAGYDTGIVMCDSFAKTLYIKIQDIMTETYQNLNMNFCIEQLDQLINYKRQKEHIEDAFGRNKHVYLYGAGEYGHRFLKMIHMWGYVPNGFIVSDGYRKTDFVEGYRVWELGELSDSDAVIVITANYEKHCEMISSLKKYGFINYFIAC